jgi:type II secretory pathway pseudopilin PulG
LIELLVVLALLAITMLLGVPALQNMITRSRTEGFARDISMLIQRTRLEAIKSNRPGVVFLDPDANAVVAFLDVDRSLDVDPSNAFNPDPDKVFRTVDFEIGRLSPPNRVFFQDEVDDTGVDSIDGLTAVEGSLGVVIRPDGSVDDEGAFRVGDPRGNRLELRISPSATGRMELRMWMPDAVGTAEDGTKWLPAGDPSDPDHEPWEWQ